MKFEFIKKLFGKKEAEAVAVAKPQTKKPVIRGAWYIVYGWMVEDLGLLGFDLQLYAIIYSYYRRGIIFSGITPYLVLWFGDWGIDIAPKLEEVLARLIKMGLVIKLKHPTKKNRHRYTINEQRIAHLQRQKI